MRKHSGIGICAICGLLLAVASGCRRQGQSSDANSIFLSGRIEGDDSNVASKLSGRIVEISVREGDTVKAGQRLARISGEQTIAARAEAQAKLEAARRAVEQATRAVAVLETQQQQLDLQEQQAKLDAQGRVSQADGESAAAQAGLAQAKADLDQNRADAARYEALAAKGAVPQQQADQYDTRVKTSQALVDAAQQKVEAANGALKIARASEANPEIRQSQKETLRQQIDEAKANVRLAQAQVDVNQAALEKSEADVQDLSIVAPFDGTVVTRAAEPGQVVTPGTTVLTVVDMSKLYLRGFIPEGEIGRVVIGQRAEVFLDSAPDTAIDAEVMRIDPEAMFTPENTYFQSDRVTQVVGVKVLLKGGYGKAKLGMPADGRIFTAASQGQH
jgi:membrane fusion protein YbhG